MLYVFCLFLIWGKLFAAAPREVATQNHFSADDLYSLFLSTLESRARDSQSDDIGCSVHLAISPLWSLILTLTKPFQFFSW